MRTLFLAYVLGSLRVAVAAPPSQVELQQEQRRALELLPPRLGAKRTGPIEVLFNTKRRPAGSDTLLGQHVKTLLAFGIAPSAESVWERAARDYDAVPAYCDGKTIVIRSEAVPWQRLLAHELVHLVEESSAGEQASSDALISATGIREGVATLVEAWLTRKRNRQILSTAFSSRWLNVDASKALSGLYQHHASLLDQVAADERVAIDLAGPTFVLQRALGNGFDSAIASSRSHQDIATMSMIPGVDAVVQTQPFAILPVGANGMTAAPRDVLGALRLGSLIAWCSNRDDAFRFASAWQADTFQTYSDGDRIAGLAWVIRWRTELDARKFEQYVDTRLNRCRKRVGVREFEISRSDSTTALITGFSAPDRPRWLVNAVAAAEHSPATMQVWNGVRLEQFVDGKYESRLLGVRLQLPAGFQRIENPLFETSGGITFGNDDGAAGGLLIFDGEATLPDRSQFVTQKGQPVKSIILETVFGRIDAGNGQVGDMNSLVGIQPICSRHGFIMLFGKWRTDGEREAIVRALRGVKATHNALACENFDTDISALHSN